MNNEQATSTITTILTALIGGVLGRYFDTQTTVAIVGALALIILWGVRMAQKRLDGLIGTAASAVAKDHGTAQVVIQGNGAVQKVATGNG